MGSRVLAMMVVVVTLVGCGKKKDPDVGFKGVKNDKFVETMNSVDLNADGNTSVNVKTAWAALKGKEVKWEMEVVDVKGGRGGRFEIMGKKEGKPLYRGYNIVAVSFDPKSGALKKGEKVTIKGLFDNKRQRKGQPLVIHVGSVEIIDAEKTK